MKMKKLIVSLVTLSTLIMSGCASEKSVNPNAVTNPPQVDMSQPYVPPGNGPGSGPGTNGSWVWGGTAPLEIAGSTQLAKNDRLSEYAGHSINNPSDIRVNMNFKKIGNNWGGTVTISYTDTDGFHEGTIFTTGGSEEEVQFNVWYHANGQTVFHAVLEDGCIDGASIWGTCGGLVIVIDEVIDLGDGEPVETVGGSIWFDNFTPTYAPHPPTRCWFVYFHKGDTPYDCRPWPSGNYNNTYAGVNPTSSDYTLLGRFSGMNLNEAFNGEFNLSDVQ